MSRRLQAVSNRKRYAAPPDLREAVDASIAEMAWRQDSDAALVALAQHLATQMMEAQDRAAELNALWGSREFDRSEHDRLRKLEAMCNVTKIVGWLGPQLQGVLKELGGTPTSRRLMKTDAPVGGALAALRDALPDSVRNSSDSGEDDPEDVD